jgi:hypothetical protein
MREINLIWLVKTDYEVAFSFDWIKNIFSNFLIKNHYDIENKFDLFVDNSILIVSVGKEPNTRLIDYINGYNSLNLNYSILHLSDEAFEQNIDFYNTSKKIIRNYYNKEYIEKYNILTIPLGYQSGIKKVDLDKDLDINFVGQLKSDRYEMLNTFNSVDKKYVLLTQRWADPNGLGVKDFSNILSRSYFTLCPRGWISLDSFRINEALESGSIPVSVLDNDGSDYFTKIYGDHPFIIGKNWNDSFEKMKDSNKEQLSYLCSKWWDNYKKSLKVKIEDFIKKN